MSKIVKLSIAGVRSFEQNDRQSISFGVPLTLIAGQNGTGKTTIIECLRYSTTGDLPPNSRGGAFINDPKVSGDKEVLAQIKLAFLNADKKQMVSTRNMQLTEKKSSRSFKTLDGLLSAIDEETRKSATVTSRCTDMDKLVPLYLGASKAVLDYVIFCHQEDSLWPLSEGTVVKKRFDEIFQVSKYTKAIDLLKVLRKDNAVNIKLAEKDVQYLEQENERAEKAERRADGLVLQIDLYSEEAEELKGKMEVITMETDEFLEKNQRFQENIYKLHTAREQRDHIEKSVERLSEGLEMMEESEEDLQRILDNFESKVEERKREKERLQGEHEVKMVKLSSTRRKFNELQVKQGQLNGETESQLERLRERREFIIEKSEELDMMDVYDEAKGEGDDYDLSKDGKSTDDSYVLKFTKNIERRIKRLESEQESIRLKGSERENEISMKIQDLSTKKLRLEQKKLSSSDSVKLYEDEIDELQNSLSSIKVDEGTIEFEKSLLNDIEKKLEFQQEKFNEVERDDELSRNKLELVSIEEDIELNNSNLVASNQYADDRAKLQLLKDDLIKRDTGLKLAIEKNNDNFERVIGKKINVETIEVDLQTAISRVSKSVDMQAELLEASQAAVSKTQTTIDLSKKEIEDKEEEVKELREEVGEVFNSFYEGDTDPVVEYESLVSELDNDLTTAIRAVEGSSFMAGYFKQAKFQAEAQNICFLCERRFESKQDRIKFIEEVVKKENNLPVSDEDLKEDFKLAQANLDQAHKIGPAVKRIRSIGLTEIPNKREELVRLRQTLETEINEKQRKLEQLDLLKSDLKEVESLRSIVSDISSNFAMTNQLKIQIENQEKKFPIDGNETNMKSASEIHQILADLNNKAKVIKSEITRLQSNKEKLLADINLIKENISNKKLELNKMESLLTEKANKLQRISSIRDNISIARKEITSANENLDKLIPQLKEKEQELINAKLESTTLEKDLNNKFTQVNQINMEINRLNKVIDEYIDKRIYLQLQECLKSIKQHEQETTTIEQEINQITSSISQEEKALLDMKGYERQVQDNIEIRKLTTKLTDLQVMIIELESHDAERNKEKYEKEMTRLRNQYAVLNSKYSSKIGEIKQLDDQLKTINEELQTEFLNVKQKYRQSIVNLETRKIGNEDLIKYSKAMDGAIMQYHSEKMQEINTIIDELWKKTYTGTDVDAIMIRSEHETAKGNRTYNYRVCMVKDDAELDMRGRCSAGQKVLACIIIRLALAECFGSKCGIIALDEPTTNLDQKNCEALAKSLSQIIESRRGQENFQLIVITHDQTFISHMNASAYTDKFFQVSRSATQGSKIECLPITQISYN